MPIVKVWNGSAWVSPTGSLGNPEDATYVTITSNPTLTNERILTNGTAITIADNGSNAVTVNATLSDVAATAVGTATAGTATTLSRSDHIHGGDYTWIVKSADESVTSSTTFQSDDHLTFTADANAFYAIECFLAVSSAAGGIKPQFTVASIAYAAGYSSLIAASGLYTTSSPLTLGNTTTANQNVLLTAMVSTGAASGAITLQWAQQASNGTATIVKKGSYLRYRKLA